MQYKEQQAKKLKHVRKMVDDGTIRGLVRDYYVKQSELELNSNIMNGGNEFQQRIWISVKKTGSVFQ